MKKLEADLSFGAVTRWKTRIIISPKGQKKHWKKTA